ncbi:MAG: transposase [Gaiellaceae bacterium]
MLADQLDYVIGVDPHCDRHALAIVEVRSGGVLLETSVEADGAGYQAALLLADRYAPGRRSFAVEGAGSYGAGLARFLADHGETVFEVGRVQRERRSAGKTDALDAVCAARSVLGDKRPAQPRAKGEREALRALMAARDGAVTAKTAALSQLRDLVVTAPESLRADLRPLSRARLLAYLATSRPDRRQDPELRGTHLALKAVARRSGDRQLNRALHQIIVTRRRMHAPTIQYSNGEPAKERPAARQPAASSATSPGTSTADSNTGGCCTLDRHRSICRRPRLMCPP